MLLNTQAAGRVKGRLRQLWKPPEQIAVPDWVEQNIHLPILTSAIPGPLNLLITPYIVGPLKAFGSRWVEHLVLVWGRQLAKSTIEYSCLSYCIDQDPGPAICLLPTEKKAKDISKEKLQPIFLACDAVRKKMTGNPDDFEILTMKFRDMLVAMTWGGSETQLTTRAARYLFRDEVDELKASLGKNLVDPMKAIEEVTSTFSNRKIFDSSTPTSEEGNIWREAQKCQRVFEYWVPCPHCQTKQILYWPNVKFGDDHDPFVVQEVAYYECEECKGRISNLEKIRSLNLGEWRARTSRDPCGQILKRIRARMEETISLDEVLEDQSLKEMAFHLPKWYSPFPGGSLGVIAKEFLEAHEAMENGDFTKMHNWTIYNAAVPWKEITATDAEIDLLKNRIDLSPLICPSDTVALTCGIDPGQGGFWYAVLAFREGGSPHLLQYGHMATDFDSHRLDEMLMEWSYEVQGKGIKMKIWRAGIDTGGTELENRDITMTAAAYDWIRRMRQPWIWGTKGMSTSSMVRLKEVRIDRMPDGTAIPGGLSLLEINTNLIKDTIWFRLTLSPDKLGRFTFHKETGIDFIRQVTAEEKKLDEKGRKWVWKQIRQRANHYLDCLAIAMALGDPSFHGGTILLAPPRATPAPPAPEKTKEKIPWVSRRKGWLRD